MMDVFFRKCAIQFNIRQCALKVLMAKLNKTFKAHLPIDPQSDAKNAFTFIVSFKALLTKLPSWNPWYRT